MTDHTRLALADFLEQLLETDIAPDGFDDRWASLASSHCLDAVYASLQHYLSDYDLRARDESYRAMQNHELRKLIRLLRVGASTESLENITFLGYSKDLP